MAAISLLDRLIEVHRDTPLSRTLQYLHSEICADQDALKSLIEQTGSTSTLSVAAGWLAEKAGRLKIWKEGEELGSVGLLEALEILALGITGKRLLWIVLKVHPWSEQWSRGGFELDHLERRAVEQFERVEALRLESARAAFAGVNAAAPDL